nr:MAG TPA: hypothetical protein [Caudoviricetes sp.]
MIFLVGWLLILASLWDVYRVWIFFQVFAWPETIIHVICTLIIWIWGYKVFSHKE